MRIAIDLQGIQSLGSRSRGIGRYSIEIVKNIIRYSTDNIFVLVGNSSMLDLHMQFKSELELDNVIYYDWYSPSPLDYLSKNKLLIELGIYLRSYAFGLLNPDLILITSLLEGYTDNCLTDLDNEFFDAPIVSIFYDLIPLLNQELYLKPNPDFTGFYKNKLKAFQRLDAVLAISESSASEAIHYLNFDKKNVFNISSACDKTLFNTLDCEQDDLLNSSPNFSSYILYSGAADPRKNLKTLVEAYGQLLSRVSSFKLILVGKLLASEIEIVKDWIIKFNIDPAKIIFKGYVSDEELVNFYKNCSLFVFPSFHEGFGLPVLEAMSCGAPVIGSNKTSIPEVISLEKAMFDPFDVASLTDLMYKALTNEDFKNELIENSKIQSKRFSWKASSLKAINAFKLIKNQFKQVDIHHNYLFSDLSKVIFDKLVLKIHRHRSLRSLIKKRYLDELSSSIDQIVKQAKFINNYFSLNEKITSWRVEGPFDSSYSLSILNRCFVNSLRNQIDNVSLSITEGLGDYEPNLNYLRNFPNVYKIYRKSLFSTNDVDVISRNLYPPRVNDLNAKLNLIHSYGWEESEFPNDWVLDFNSYLDGISVMSMQVKKILIDNGVSIPISVTSLGLDHLDDIKADDTFIIKAKTYKILHISSCFPRKGIDSLLNAYGQCFSISDDVTLVIKTFPNPHNKIDEILEKYKKTKEYPDVVLLKEELNDPQLKSLYLQSNLLVAPSRGEGFGLPIGEAMRLGIPVITTSWGGQRDFCNESNCWLVDYQFSHSESHFNLDLSYWADPIINDLKNKIKEVYYLSESQLSTKTLKAFHETDLFRWDNLAEMNKIFVDKITANKSLSKTKIGWMTTWFSKCGIASYSKNLIDLIPDEIEIFAPLNEKSISNDKYSVLQSWYLDSDDQDNLNSLLKLIKLKNITTYIIQFNYGLFKFDFLTRLIHALKERRIKVIVFLHSTLDPVNDPKKKLNLLQIPLSLCDRVIVHTITDLNRLKKVNLINNVTLLPHGIPEFRSDIEKKINSNSNCFIKNNKTLSIATFGFCLPNKGYRELVRSISLLKEREFFVNLTIYCASYSEDYNWYYEEIKDEVVKLGLAKSVTIDNTFYSEIEIFERLLLNELIVYPYQSSGESSSASVRFGLATGKPVLVTPLPIFDDVKQLVDYLPGMTCEEIAEGIISSIKQSNNQISNNIRKELIHHRGFSKIAHRFYSLIKSIEINEKF